MTTSWPPPDSNPPRLLHPPQPLTSDPLKRLLTTEICPYLIPTLTIYPLPARTTPLQCLMKKWEVMQTTLRPKTETGLKKVTPRIPTGVHVMFARGEDLQVKFATPSMYVTTIKEEMIICGRMRMYSTDFNSVNF